MLEGPDWEVAKGSALLASAPEDVVQTIRANSMVARFERGSTVFLQGERAHSIYIVLDGWVKLYRISPNGAEAVVGVFTKGQSFGEAVAFQNMTYPVAAEAVTDCRLYQVKAGLVVELMKSRPELCTALIGAVFRHLHGLVMQIEQLKAQTGAQRVAEFLIDLCPVEEGACTVTLPYDKVLIAGRLGMQPESLSRAFGRLRDSGVSIRQNSAAIADVRRLRDYVESDRAAIGNPF